MRLALNEAREAFSRGEVPIGAVIVSGGAIVGRGHNLVETLTDVTAHAEIQALTAASATLGGKYLPDCTLYVTVEPCVMCAGALAWSQIGRIVYGASDPKRGYTRVGNALLHPAVQTATDAKRHTSPCTATDTTSTAWGTSDGKCDTLPNVAAGTTNCTPPRPDARVAMNIADTTQNTTDNTPTARVTSDGKCDTSLCVATDTATGTTHCTPPRPDARVAMNIADTTQNTTDNTPTAWGTSDGTPTPPPARGASDEAVAKLLLHPKTRVTAGVLAAECEALMSEFFMKLRH